jgi:predicted DNA-binding protein with PD1-like motif
MEVLRDGNQRLLRFAKGDELMAGIVDYCSRQRIDAAAFSGIGAAAKAVISWYDIGAKKYLETTIDEECEILNITGNASIKEGNRFAHAHVTLGKKDYSTIGGHVHSLIVGATCELHMTVFAGTMKRFKDDATGLYLLS